MKTNYNITIGFKAVININVDAESVEAAKKVAEETFEREIKKAFQKKLNLEDSEYVVAGVLDMDASWNQIHN